MKYVIGLDIGGTKIMAALATINGDIVKRLRLQTPPELVDGIQMLKDMVYELMPSEGLVSIGAGIGGPLNWKQGIVSPLHQPKWRNVPLKAIMQEEFGYPFAVDVDTNVGALGEYMFGGDAVPRLLYVTVSTGVGGGFLANGKIYRGVNDTHPEIGHQAVPFRCRYPKKVSCDCGSSDCLEALVSGSGIQRIYGKPAEDLKDEEWEDVGYNLGQGLRNLAVVYAPEVIVLSGGVIIGAADKLLQPAKTVVDERLNIMPAPQIRISILGYDAALYGAIALAIQNAV